MTVIAIEEHWMLPELATALAGQPDPDQSLVLNDFGDAGERLADLGQGRLAAMDEQGIDIAVLALTPPGTSPLDAAQARDLARLANYRAAAAVAQHPSRYRALSTLPLSAPAHAAEELTRAAALGCVGAMVYGRSGDRFLDDPAFDDTLAAAAALEQPLFIHPQIPSDAVRAASYQGLGTLTDLGLATFGWGWHIEAATAALRLALSGAFDRHPGLQVVLGHWGELLPFWLDRIDGLSRVAKLQRPVSELLRTNFHITASGMLNPTLLQHVLTVTGVDRLLFSTDYPFQRPDRAQIAALTDHFGTDADRVKFLSGNAAALFGITTTPTDRPQEQP